MLTLEAKVMSVRLPEVEVRKYKILAASQGISMQEAVHRALERWAAEEPAVVAGSLDELQGSLADADVAGLMKSERAAELRKDEVRG